MTGEHQVIVRTNRLQFKFTLKRNITVLRGNSATGKTTLIELIEQHQNNRNGSGIEISCDKKCVVLTENNWQVILAATKDSLVFIDEGVYFLNTKEFAHAVKNSDNYYCISVRDNLPLLPYSVDEIYTLKNTTKKYGTFKRTYASFQQIYSKEKISPSEIKKPDVVIAEDSNSGWQFFSNYFEKLNISCISAKGNSNVASEILKIDSSKNILIIADGAAFGAFIEKIMNLKFSRSITIYLPESFEWLILDSGLIKSTDLKEILSHPSDYIESSQYFSWEQFFTHLLQEKTKGTYLQYNKSKLNNAYLQKHEQKTIAANSILGKVESII